MSFVHTASGTVYQFTKDGMKVRRLRHRNPVDPEAEERSELRQDGLWLHLYEPAIPVVGLPMVLAYEVLDPPQEEGASVTIRTTTPVVAVEGD